MPFQFLDPGRLIDAELELVTPDPRWIDEVLDACKHPLTQRDAPAEASISRRKLHEFLSMAPGGRQPGGAEPGQLPAYHFWMRLDWPIGHPPIRIAGGIGLRIGTNPEIELYSGNVGYHVYPPARGHHYASRACRLVLPLAKAHGMDHIWITCNPDNYSSRRTIEHLGGRLIEIVEIPPDHQFRSRGETAKCRYLVKT
jgi:predicted acetyltransferase